MARRPQSLLKAAAEYGAAVIRASGKPMTQAIAIQLQDLRSKLGGEAVAYASTSGRGGQKCTS